MNNLHKQRGIALFSALLILPLLLALGLVVMTNTFLGMKMTDARVLQGGSNIILNSAATEIMNRSGSAQSFASSTNGTIFSYKSVTGSVEGYGEINCKRRIKASSNNFKCRYLQVNFEHSFGRVKTDGTRWAINTMSVGIEQPVISK